MAHPSPISKLPIELLTRIARELVTLTPTRDPNEPFSSPVHPLCLVSRTWAAAARPVLYSSLFFDLNAGFGSQRSEHDGGSPDHKNLCLFSLVTTRPDLSMFARELQLQWISRVEHDLILGYILSHLPNLDKVWLHSTDSADEGWDGTLGILHRERPQLRSLTIDEIREGHWRTLERFADLEDFTLEPRYSNWYSNTVAAHLPPTLRRLDLYQPALSSDFTLSITPSVNTLRHLSLTFPVDKGFFGRPRSSDPITDVSFLINLQRLDLIVDSKPFADEDFLDAFSRLSVILTSTHSLPFLSTLSLSCNFKLPGFSAPTVYDRIDLADLVYEADLFSSLPPRLDLLRLSGFPLLLGDATNLVKGHDVPVVEFGATGVYVRPEKRAVDEKQRNELERLAERKGKRVDWMREM
ncbi:hypothetical protein JCM6882_003842 [Rhodosporidiobolus microsporus]